MRDEKEMLRYIEKLRKENEALPKEYHSTNKNKIRILQWCLGIRTNPYPERGINLLNSEDLKAFQSEMKLREQLNMVKYI